VVKFAFKDKKLERLFLQGEGAELLPENVVRRFLFVMEFIRDAQDERIFYMAKSFQTEKLHGDRTGQFSVRLNKQFRLCFEIHKDQNGNIIYILEIVDYH
jgi:toxin HigB-1